MESDLLLLEISDQGPGFALQPATLMTGHLGLTGMRERVESLGGTFSVKSEIGQGTQVTARLPLHPEEGKDER
jgi:two-component system NarL family sensor kinase